MPVARMTSRAGMRTRTVVPTAHVTVRSASSVPPSNVSSTRPRAGCRRATTRVEDAAQADRVAQPRQVRTAHQRRQTGRTPRRGPARASARASPAARRRRNRASRESAGCRACAAARRSRPADAGARARSTAANGSSSSSTAGSRASARASATRWRSPPESSCGRRSACPERCTSREQRSARARRSARGRCPSAVITLPSAVRCGKSAYSWNTNPTARRCGGAKAPVAVSVQVSPPDRTDACAGR